MSILDGADLLSEGMALVARAEREGRDLTPDELARYDAIVSQLQGRGRDSPPDGQPQQVEHKAAAAESAASAFSDAGPTPSKETRKMVAADNRYLELIDKRAQALRENKEAMELAIAAGRDLSPTELDEQAKRNSQIQHWSNQIDAMEAIRDAERLVSGGKGSAPAMSNAYRPQPTDSVRPLAQDANWGYQFGVRMVDAKNPIERFSGIPAAFDVALGDYLMAVSKAYTNQGVDPRLFSAGPSGGSTGVPSDGGYMVGTDFSLALMQVAMQEAVLAPRCHPFDISGSADGLEAPYLNETSRANGSRMGGVRVYRAGEADTVAASKPTLAMFELRLADLMGVAYVTDRLLQDAAALGQVYRDAFASEFAFKLDDEIFRGSGVGECAGIIDSGTNPALVTQAVETGQTLADPIVAENIQNMFARLHPRHRAKAVWLISLELEPYLQRLAQDIGTGGQLVYMPPGGLSQTPYSTLQGRPVIPIEHASAVGTVGDLVLVDLYEYALIRKGGIAFDESMHVRFLYNERTFRWVQRINGKPKWRSALTPYQGTNTLSPFVTLAARS